MKEQTAKRYEGKKIFLKTTFGRFFTIDVEEVDSEFISGTDKFGEPCDVALNDIATIVPVSGTSTKW